MSYILEYCSCFLLQSRLISYNLYPYSSIESIKITLVIHIIYQRADPLDTSIVSKGQLWSEMPVVEGYNIYIYIPK